MSAAQSSLIASSVWSYFSSSTEPPSRGRLPTSCVCLSEYYPQTRSHARPLASARLRSITTPLYPMMTMSIQSRKRVYKFSPLVIFPSSQKTIPFTVPVSAPAVCRRLPTDGSSNYLDDLVANSRAYSDSESAASPSPSASAHRRNSHGSVSSIDSKGR